MKKITKILFLILSFVLVFAACAVAAFAADEQGWKDSKVLKEIDFEGVPDDYYYNGDEGTESPNLDGGTFVFADWNGLAPRTGWVKALVSLDGNTSVAYYTSTAKSKLAPYFYIKVGDAPTQSGANVMSKNASYFVLDWDMYSPTGNYGASAGPSIKYVFSLLKSDGKSASVAPMFSQVRTDKNGNTIMNGITLASSLQWQHYTTIIEVVKTYDADGNLLYNANGHLFVDGMLVQSISNMISGYGYNDYFKSDTSLVNLTELRIELVATQGQKTGTESIALDNMTIRSFTKYYGGAPQIASVIAGQRALDEWDDSVFTKNYDYPFGLLAATVTAPDESVSYYDNAQKAFANAPAGSFVELHRDAAGASINSSVTVKTNGYKFDFTSDLYSANLIEENTYQFTRSQNSVLKVYWDMENTEGNLFDITSSVLGSIPSHPKDLSNYIVYDYAEDDVEETTPIGATTLIGWSYSKENAKAGKVDEIRPITVWDIESSTGAWIALYPVYAKSVVRVVTPDNAVFFYDDLTTAISACPAGSTVQLLRDFELTEGFSISKNMTVDLNGHTIILNDNNVINRLNDDGKVVGYGSKPALFKVPAGVEFVIDSSLPGAKIFVSACVLQKYESTGVVKNSVVMGSSVVYLSASGTKDVDVTINGENLTVYASTIVADWATNLKGNVTINGGSYYRTISDLQGLFSPRSTNHLDFTVNDAFLYSTHGFILSDEAAKGAANVGGEYSFTFNNCVFYTPDNAQGKVTGIVNNDDECSVYINNSVIATRITSAPAGKITIGEGCIYDAADITFGDKTVVADGCQAFEKATESSFDYIPNSFIRDTEKHEILPDSYTLPEVKIIGRTFDTWIAGPTNSLIIKWLDVDGETVLASGVGLQGHDATPPARDLVVEWKDGDGWRNLVVSSWKNPEGKVNEFFVPEGVTGEYVFVAVDPNEALAEGQEVRYGANPTKIVWNIALGSKIDINFYVPVEDGVTLDSIKIGSTALTIAADTEIIGEVEYKKATYTIVSTDAHVGYAATISYTIDGVSYTAELSSVSALEYINSIIDTEEISAEQKTLIADTMRYTAELCKKDSGEVPAEYAEFVEKYADILTPYEYDSENRVALAEEVKTYVEKVDVGVVDGKPSILIYWTKSARSLAKKDLVIYITRNSNEGLSTKDSGAPVKQTSKIYYSVVEIVDSSYLDQTFNIAVMNEEIYEVATYSFESMILDLKDAGLDAGLAESLYALEKTKNSAESSTDDVVFPLASVLPGKKEE